METIGDRSRPRPLAILFDWDNTLVDNWRSIHAALNATFLAMDHAPWTPEETRQRVRRSLRDSFPEMFGERWNEAREIFYRTIRAEHLHHLEAMPGAGAMLDRLAALGDFHLGVVSNKTGTLLRAEADHLGWSRYFAQVVGANDAPRDKPAPDPIYMALAGSGLDEALREGPSVHVWYVGDAGIDAQCAHNAGCVPVLLHSGEPDEAEFAGYPPALRVRSCPEFLALVEELSS